MNNKLIAETILNQLGGTGRLKAFVNGRNFTYDKNGTVRFTFSGNRKMNQVEIALNGMDLYDVKFIKYTAGKLNMKDFTYTDDKWITKEEVNDVYAEDLVELFERTTNLFLHF